jgi:hypothetical protein
MPVDCVTLFECQRIWSTELKSKLGRVNRGKSVLIGILDLQYISFMVVMLLHSSNLIGSNIERGTSTDVVGEANGVKKTTSLEFNQLE